MGIQESITNFNGKRFGKWQLGRPIRKWSTTKDESQRNRFWWREADKKWLKIVPHGELRIFEFYYQKFSWRLGDRGSIPSRGTGSLD